MQFILKDGKTVEYDWSSEEEEEAVNADEEQANNLNAEVDEEGKLFEKKTQLNK